MYRTWYRTYVLCDILVSWQIGTVTNYLKFGVFLYNNTGISIRMYIQGGSDKSGIYDSTQLKIIRFY
jgi:hypothetical protein